MKKKLFRLFSLLLCLMLLLPALALADDGETGGGETGGTGEETPGETGGDTPAADPLTMDTEHWYGAMGKTIAQGYVPTVADGHATFILPILGSTQGQVIHIEPVLSAGGPFVLGSYGIDVRRTSEKATDEKKEETTQDVFLAVLQIPLSDTRYNGVYPVTFTVTYTDVNGNAQTQTFSESVTITDGRKASSGSHSTAEKRPLLLVDACTVFPTAVQGGGSFSVTLTMQNLGDKDAKNIRVILSDEEGAMICTDTLNAQYLDLLAVDMTTQLRFNFDVARAATAGPHYLKTEITYSDKSGGSYTEEASVRVDVEQPASIGYDPVTLPQSVSGNDSFEQLVYVYNTGYTTLYNVRVELSADGLICSTAYLGNLEPQQDASKAIKVYTTMLSGTPSYGKTYGSVSILYEDEKGETHLAASMDVSTTLTEPVKVTDEEKQKQEEALARQKSFSQWWVSLLVGLAVIAILVAVIVVRRVLRELRMR